MMPFALPQRLHHHINTTQKSVIYVTDVWFFSINVKARPNSNLYIQVLFLILHVCILTSEYELDGGLCAVRLAAHDALVHARVLALHPRDHQQVLSC